MTVTLAEELVLLAYDDAQGHVVTVHLDYAVVGALLQDLALAGRIEPAGDVVTVTDAGPTGDPLLDNVLARIGADEHRRKPAAWVQRLYAGAADRVLDRLVSDGVLRRERDRVLWVFPRTRYPATGGVQPPAEVDCRQRMRAAVAGDGPVAPRTAALCALVRAVDLSGKVFAGLPGRHVADRLTEISAGAWGATAVKDALDEMNAVVIIAAAG